MVTSTTTPPRTAPPARTRLFGLPEVRWAAAALGLFVAGLALQLAGAPEWSWWGLYLACYATGGWEPAVAGVQALREKTLDVDLLMVLAALGAASLGEITDGALLIVIFATSGALEALATARTEESVRGLLDLAPDTATLVTASGVEQVRPATELEIADEVLIRPGERIPADGTVLAGSSDVDQATITGEPLPVDVAAGSEVFAGTLNGTGSLRVRVGRRAEDSVVARIAALVEQAGRTKARTQLFIERVEQRYSVGMVAATVALFAVPLLFGSDLRESLLRAMTFMIVASPCAVVLATMPPLLAAIANAGRQGVLVKSAVVMERLGTTTKVAFDKTGTLTRGTPEVTEVRVLDAELTREELLRLAAAAERPSEHPLAAAVVRAAQREQLRLPPADDFAALPGRGVTARVAGHRVEIGAAPADVEVQPGRTPVLVRRDGDPVGLLAIADQPRPEAADAVAATRALTTEPVLLTGDTAAGAGEIAERVGITDVRAGLLPDDKLDEIQRMGSAGHRVAFVGDGINDAPAMAGSHAGIAVGGAASDLTLQTADAVIVREDLNTIPAVIEFSRRARRVVTANLVIAGAFIAVLVTWDLVGHLPLPLGVAGHEGSTVLVALNGLRLLRRRAFPTPPPPLTAQLPLTAQRRSNFARGATWNFRRRTSREVRTANPVTRPNTRELTTRPRVGRGLPRRVAAKHRHVPPAGGEARHASGTGGPPPGSPSATSPTGSRIRHVPREFGQAVHTRVPTSCACAFRQPCTSRAPAVFAEPVHVRAAQPGHA
ncbi:heavy metal translocating P-type ATPase [Saccharopolyspora rhizosphaerae]|nr:heavy metal translocating P-type ATPase [Saccharopolyspora rhizosphaerae]